MKKEKITKEEKQLRLCVRYIKSDFAKMEKAAKTAVERATHAFKLEIGKSLIHAKKQVGEDAWPQWLKENLAQVPLSIAKECFNMATEWIEHRKKAAAEVEERLKKWERKRRGAMTPEDLAEEEQRRREIDEKVRQTVENARRAVEEAKKRAERQRAAQAMAHELLNAGKRAIAMKLHPDKGGDHEDMIVLQSACDLLKEWLPMRKRRLIYAEASNYELRALKKECSAAGRKLPAALKRELKKRFA